MQGFYFYWSIYLFICYLFVFKFLIDFNDYDI